MIQDNEQFEDPEIQEWIDNYDIKIDKDSCIQYTEALTQDFTKKLILSTCKKIAALEAIEASNNILKHHLNTPIEIDAKTLLEEIEKISEFEFKVMALATTNLSEATKVSILEKYIDSINSVKDNKEKLKKNPIIDLLRGEINKINNELSERASRDINRVEKRNRNRK